MWWKLIGFCRARMGNVDAHHSVRSSGSSCTLGETENAKMVGDKEGDVFELKSDERATIEEEGEEKEQDGRTIRGSLYVSQAERSMMNT